MTPDELAALGDQIGELANTRPDITHQILVGVQHGMERGPNPTGYGFGELLYKLQRWWYHHIADPDTNPPIPFNMGARPSGIGLNPWRFHQDR